MRYRDQRYPAETTVRLIYGDEMHLVDLLNISATGARVEHLDVLPAGALVTISYLHVRVPARVVRSNGAETSVRFVTPLQSPDLSAIRGAKGGHAGGWGTTSHVRFRELT